MRGCIAWRNFREDPECELRLSRFLRTTPGRGSKKFAEPEAIFRITYGRSDSCCEIRRPSSGRHRFLRAFGLSRNRESPLVMPTSMGDLAMPCPGLLTHSVSALASAAIFLRVRRRTRLLNAAPIVEIGP